jgi:hypothetical protein
VGQTRANWTAAAQTLVGKRLDMLQRLQVVE